MAWNIAEALKLRFGGGSEYEDEDEYLDEEEYEEEKPAKKKGAKGFGIISPFSGKQRAVEENVPDHEVYAIQPQSYDDVNQITDRLLAGWTVVLNTERCDEALAMRIFDFTCGTSYALNCTFGRVSYSATKSYAGIFIITPDNTNMSGAFQETLLS
ncbi:MAG: cell division protein SepF [Lachnospiraceae bacterium]|nr:cell division protein SepF [Lachnospiraceae bacterium]